MTRVLLTGGSGFIAAHVLDTLLKHGHSVVTTVRSQTKASNIRKAHADLGKDRLDFAIVEDIAKEDAFDKAVVSEPPFEAIIHTASPFHFNVTDTEKDLLNPAIIGTTGILKAAKKYAPSVKRVVITSSFAAILNPANSTANYVYSEADFNPVTREQASADPATGYRASKTLAEKAAWEFVEKEKPNFDVATCNPPLVFGPVVHYLNSIDAINTSNQRFRDFMQGKNKDKCPATGIYLWVDVRDVAKAHVLAMEKKEAGGKRFFLTAGHYSNKQIVEVIAKDFPKYKDRMPQGEALKEGDFPAKDQLMGYDNSRSKQILGMTYRSIETCVVDTVKSLEGMVE